MSESVARYHIRFSRRAVRRLVLGAAAVMVAMLVTTALGQIYQTELSTLGSWSIARRHTSLIGERSVAVWIAAILILVVASACVLCYLAERNVPDRARGRWSWLVVAAAFAALSLDEAGSVHERFGQLRSSGFAGDSSTAFLILFGIPLTAGAVAMSLYAWRRLRREPLVAALLIGGVVLLSSVLVHEELELNDWKARHAAAAAEGGEMAPRAWEMIVFEEGSELAGILLLLTGTLIYAHRAGAGSERPGRGLGAVEVAVAPGEIRRGLRTVVMMLTLGLTAAAIVHFVAPTPEQLGEPMSWFAAVPALTAAAAVWLLPRSPGAVDARLILSLACVLWSVDQGAGYLLTDNIWRGSPRMQLGVRLLLAAGTAAAAVLALTRLPHGTESRMRGPVLLWGALATVAPVTGHPVAISALLLAAHLALLRGTARTFLAGNAPAATQPVSGPAAPPRSARPPARPTPPAATA